MVRIESKSAIRISCAGACGYGVVGPDPCNVLKADSFGSEAIIDGLRHWLLVTKAQAILCPGQPFLLDDHSNVTSSHQRCREVMIGPTEAQDPRILSHHTA